MVQCQQCLDDEARCSLAGQRRNTLKTCTRCKRKQLVCVPGRSGSSKHVSPPTSTRDELTPGKADPMIIDSNAPNTAHQPRVKVWIAYDFGTSSTKAAFRITKRGVFGPVPQYRETVGAVETIQFPNGQFFVPTQVAWENIKGTNPQEYRQLWGHEVTVAALAGRIGSDDIFSRLKPIVFQENHPELRKIQGKISQLDDTIRRRRRSGTEPHEEELDDIDHLHLLSDYMGHVHRYVLSRIANLHKEIKWPRDPNSYRDWQPPLDAEVQVSILLPVAATPGQQQTILNIAKLAGIPNLSTVGEPTAALVRHAYVGGEDYTGRILALLDIGAGSVDLQIWKIVSMKPLRIQEVVAGKTEWCGGDSVNREAGHLMLDGIGSRNILEVLGCLQTLTRTKNISESQFRDVLENEFEDSKRGFVPPYSSSCELHVEGLPEEAAWRMADRNTIVLTPQDMKNIYEVPLRKTLAMLRSARDEMKQRGYPQPFDTIVMFGGGASDYIQHQIETACEPNSSLGFDCEVMSIRPTDASFMTAAAVGAIFIQQDEGILDKRVILRGYFVARHIIATDLSNDQGNLEYFAHDQQWRLTYVSKSLIQPGTTVGRHHVARIRGERALHPEDRDDQLGWIHEEPLYYSDQPIEDDTWAKRGGNGMHEMPNPLRFRITAEMARGYPIEMSANRSHRWYIIEYEIRLVLENNELIFQLVVPDTGKFSTPGLQDVGVKITPGKYDVAGNFRLPS